jgi:hypothetical protein
MAISHFVQLFQETARWNPLRWSGSWLVGTSALALENASADSRPDKIRVLSRQEPILFEYTKKNLDHIYDKNSIF